MKTEKVILDPYFISFKIEEKDKEHILRILEGPYGILTKVEGNKLRFSILRICHGAVSIDFIFPKKSPEGKIIDLFYKNIDLAGLKVIFEPEKNLLTFKVDSPAKQVLRISTSISIKC
ncbi:MAG: hypothetical protein PHG24_02770 [Candidatus Pacebacteria bacterium]|nr:hypothetical protein [Candidatus Paceibacterota bacterium]